MQRAGPNTSWDFWWHMPEVRSNDHEMSEWPQDSDVCVCVCVHACMHACTHTCLSISMFIFHYLF